MGKIIVLDPGHGANEKNKFSRPLMDCTGSKAICVPDSMVLHPDDGKPNFYREDFGTLKIAQEVAAELRCEGHTVFLTRNDYHNAAMYLSSFSNNDWKKKHWKSWKWIREFTKSKNADVFVSIHTNAGGGTGTSAFWASTPNGVDLCKSMTQELHDQVGLRIRRVAKHRYLILRNVCE